MRTLPIRLAVWVLCALWDQLCGAALWHTVITSAICRGWNRRALVVFLVVLAEYLQAMLHTLSHTETDIITSFSSL